MKTRKKTNRPKHNQSVRAVSKKLVKEAQDARKKALREGKNPPV